MVPPTLWRQVNARLEKGWSSMKNVDSRLLSGCLAGGLLLAVLLVGCRTPAAGTTGSAPSANSSSTAGQPTATSSPSSTPAGSSSSPPQLACVLTSVVQPVDTVRETLHCTVTHVTSSETAFELHYTVVNSVGRTQTIAPCRGALSGGSGSCTATFSLVVPLSLSKGTVSGATEPDQYPLGPVIPKQTRGTSTGSPLSPLFSQSPSR